MFAFPPWKAIVWVVRRKKIVSEQRSGWEWPSRHDSFARRRRCSTQNGAVECACVIRTRVNGGPTREHILLYVELLARIMGCFVCWSCSAAAAAMANVWGALSIWAQLRTTTYNLPIDILADAAAAPSPVSPVLVVAITIIIIIYPVYCVLSPCNNVWVCFTWKGDLESPRAKRLCAYAGVVNGCCSPREGGMDSSS